LPLDWRVGLPGEHRHRIAWMCSACRRGFPWASAAEDAEALD